jgi:hypothetical protein
MNASLLAALNDAERLLVAQTERAALAALDEDAAIDLEARIRRARNKFVGQYRRGASARVVEHGARGQAAPENRQAALKAEAGQHPCGGCPPAGQARQPMTSAACWTPPHVEKN